jgi:hypothetical protein
VAQTFTPNDSAGELNTPSRSFMLLLGAGGPRPDNGEGSCETGGAGELDIDNVPRSSSILADFAAGDGTGSSVVEVKSRSRRFSTFDFDCA